jgi:phage N-6-adenine-methyltransferase
VSGRMTPKSLHKRPRGRPRKHADNAAKCRAYRQRQKRLVYHRQESDRWYTPKDKFKALDDEFHFTIDVCADPENATCKRYYTPEQDGLQQDWTGEVVFCNPPYSQVARWIHKAYEASKTGTTLVVCVVSASVDTDWFQTYVLPYAEYRFPKGRWKFGGSRHNAPRPTAIVIFRPPAETHTH